MPELKMLHGTHGKKEDITTSQLDCWQRKGNVIQLR